MTSAAEHDAAETTVRRADGWFPMVYAGPDRPTVPVGRSPHRHHARFLEVDGDLGTEDSPHRGYLVEVEAEWTPLGWALEDWIDTIAAAPREQSALGEAEVEHTFQSEEAQFTDEAANATSVESGSVSTEEVMRLAANAMTSGRGVTAGLNATRGDSRISFTDPVSSLAQAVTGAFQLGYSSSSTKQSASYGGAITKGLSNAMERVTRQLRSTAARTSSIGTSRLLDQRRLRVFGNPSAERTLNLAVFSVSRQWSVATRELRCEPVVFVEIDRLNEVIDEQDVFVHRAVLSGVLLDTALSGALENVAARYGCGNAAEPPHITRIVGTIFFSDPAEHGGRVSIELVALRGLRRDRVDQKTLLETVKGEPYRFGLDASGLRFDDGLELVLTMSTGPNIRDLKAVVSYLHLTAELSDGSCGPVYDQEPHLVLPHGVAQSVRLPRTAAAAAPPRPAEVNRLLGHLNANLPYYRLAIDLQRDAVSRFVRLRARGQTAPLDMNPVGIAGAHLAFLCGDDEAQSADKRELAPPPAESMTLSTPAEGVFVEAIGGASTIDGREAEWPTLPGGKDGGFAWPPVSPLAPPARASASDSAAAGNGSAPATAAAPAVPASELAGKADLTGQLDSGTSFAGKLAAASGSAIPGAVTQPAAPPSGAPGASATAPTSGSGAAGVPPADGRS